MPTTDRAAAVGSPEILEETGEFANDGLPLDDLATRRKPAAVKRISIFGLGYVGAVSMACLARDGHRVVGVDVDSAKLDLIRARKSPILEEGIQELMRDVVDSGRVAVTQDARRAVEETEVSFVCVGTPSSSNGSQDLGAITRLAEQIGAVWKFVYVSPFFARRSMVGRCITPPNVVEPA